VIRTRTLHLHETGVAEYDAITIEHNGLLAEPGFEQVVVDAAVHHVGLREDWDELYLSGMLPVELALWTRAAGRVGLWQLVRGDHHHHSVDLAAIRHAGIAYLDGLSANTRYQIRRAMKRYATRGALALQRASTFKECEAWAGELVRLHQAYWQGQGQPGAFASGYAQRFHEGLRARAWSKGAVELTRVTAGEHVLGYLYNFRKGATLYNYQSGFAYEADTRLKPGLVCHALAAEEALHRGLARYDLLAGGGHYKQSLANSSGNMVWAVLQKRRLLIGIENGLRQVRDRWKAARQRGPLPRQE
jgi:CelD/BcsL family acetyltransferase involved in cellulose biosynthesis